MNQAAETIGAALGHVAARLDAWKKERDAIAGDVRRMVFVHAPPRQPGGQPSRQRSDGRTARQRRGIRAEGCGSAAGQVTGKVTETRYHGHDALVTVDVPGMGPVRARVAGDDAPAPGDEVALGVIGPVIAWRG